MGQCSWVVTRQRRTKGGGGGGGVGGKGREAVETPPSTGRQGGFSKRKFKKVNRQIAAEGYLGQEEGKPAHVEEKKGGAGETPGKKAQE